MSEDLENKQEEICIRRRVLEDLKQGDVFKYSSDHGYDLYFTVNDVKEGKIYGQISGPYTKNNILLIEELAKKKLEKANWHRV